MYYPAVLTREGDRTLISFPDLPGCQTFVEPGEDLVATAEEALSGWLEVGLEDGEAPPRPSPVGSVHAEQGTQIQKIPVSTQLGVALSVRWARQEAGLTQSELARKMGVTQQQAAKLERPTANPTVETLARVAGALDVDMDVMMSRRES